MRMGSLRTLSADKQPLENFKTEVRNARNASVQQGQNVRSTSTQGPQPDTIGSIPMHLFEWSHQEPHVRENDGIKSVGNLDELDNPGVRVIFAPRDIPDPGYGNSLATLFEKFSIPSAFISEGLQGVSQSFSYRTDDDGSVYIWFHFLLKDLAVAQDLGHRRVVHNGPIEIDRNGGLNRNDPTRQSQANFTWIKPGFILKIESLQKPPTTQNPPIVSNSDTTLNEISKTKRVTFFCFGAPGSIGTRFQQLKHLIQVDHILQDPYFLLEVVFEEMWKLMDHTAWLVSDIFGEMETKTLGRTTDLGEVDKILDGEHFTGLHNLAKHTIYLRENCESALATLESLRRCHGRTFGDSPNPWQEYTHQAMDYRKSLFQSTQRRLSSLDKRMTNIIQLSFNLVTQADSRIMRSENQSMKTIALMTLIFMPLGTVATVFGTQLIKLKDDAPYHMEISRDFWLLWVISFPLTLIVIILSQAWYRDAKIQLGVKRTNAEHSYLSWRRLKKNVSTRWTTNTI